MAKRTWSAGERATRERKLAKKAERRALKKIREQEWRDALEWFLDRDNAQAFIDIALQTSQHILPFDDSWTGSLLLSRKCVPRQTATKKSKTTRSPSAVQKPTVPPEEKQLSWWHI